MSLWIAMITTELDNRVAILEAIKGFPEIWDTSNPRYGAADSAWDELHNKFNMDRHKLRQIWSTCIHYYTLILKTKTIERNNSLPKWPFFHNMSFMYEITKNKLAEKLGGLLPPLFIPQRGNDTESCPCCLPLVVATVSATDKEKLSGQPPKKKPKTSNAKTAEMYAYEREIIINAIKAHPILHSKTKKRPPGAVPPGSLSSTQAWKVIAKQVGLPVVTVQSRWKLFKDRYVSELIREKSVNGVYQSGWENFEQMSFMRAVLMEVVDDMIKTRNNIQKIVEEKKKIQTIDLCEDEDDPCSENNNFDEQQISINNPNETIYVGNTDTIDTNSCYEVNFLENNVQSLDYQNSEECPVIALDSSEDEVDDDSFLDPIVYEFDNDDNESFVTNSTVDLDTQEIFLAEEDDNGSVCVDEETSLSSAVENAKNT